MKNIAVVILLILLYGCGYTSVYKDQKSKDIKITIIDTQGDNIMNNYLKNQISIISNDESENIFNISFKSEFKKITISKNSAGVATDYKLKAKIEFYINKKEINKTINLSENLNIKNQGENFEQTNYENLIKRNFVISIKNKLIPYLINFDDS